MNPLPGPFPQSVWADVNRGYGVDILNNYVKVSTYKAATALPPISIGSTVYTSLLYQGGANPYALSGPGTAHNRYVAGNPYGIAFDKDGNFFICSLFDYQGFNAFDASGNFIKHYGISGCRSTVTRGALTVDTTNGDIYWADALSPVIRYKKTGPGIDTYVQDNEPFYVGTVFGGAVALRGNSPTLRAATSPSALDGTPITLIYINTPRDQNAASPGTDALTVMRPDGTVDARYSNTNSSYATVASCRGIDVTPDGTKVMMAGWAGPTLFPKVYVFSGLVVPVELSQFESVVE